MAGKEIHKVSFNFILTIKPNIINKPSPKDEIINIGFKNNPTIKPVAPKNSRVMINSPSFSNLKRLNSFFIFGDKK